VPVSADLLSQSLPSILQVSFREQKAEDRDKPHEQWIKVRGHQIACIKDNKARFLRAQQKIVQIVEKECKKRKHLMRLLPHVYCSLDSEYGSFYSDQASYVMSVLHLEDPVFAKWIERCAGISDTTHRDSIVYYF